MKVKYKDKDKKIQMVNVALRSVGFDIDYPATELIIKTLEMLELKGEKTTIKDSAIIVAAHENKWNNYFNPKQK